MRCCRRWIDLDASRGKPLAAVSLRTSFPLTLKRSRNPCIHAGFSGGGWVDGVRVCVFVSGRPSGRPGLLPAAALRPGWRGTRPEEAIAGGVGTRPFCFWVSGQARRDVRSCAAVGVAGTENHPSPFSVGQAPTAARMLRRAWPGTQKPTAAAWTRRLRPGRRRVRAPEAWPLFPSRWPGFCFCCCFCFCPGPRGLSDICLSGLPARPPLLLMENHNCPLGRAHRSEAPNPPQQKAGALGGGTKWSRLRPAPAKTGPALQRGPVFVRPRMLIAGARVQRPGREGSTAAATAASCRTRATALSWRAACRERSRPATPCPGRRCG